MYVLLTVCQRIFVCFMCSMVRKRRAREHSIHVNLWIYTCVLRYKHRQPITERALACVYFAVLCVYIWQWNREKRETDDIPTTQHLALYVVCRIVIYLILHMYSNTQRSVEKRTNIDCCCSRCYGTFQWYFD